MQLVLASASPRRAELLRTAGFTFEVRPADVDETPRPAEPPATYALRVARDKALAAAERVNGTDAWILAADTVVVVDGRILGKPTGPADARRMLSLLSGVVHEVLDRGCGPACGERNQRGGLDARPLHDPQRG